MRLYACLGSGNCFKPWLAMTQLGMPFEMTLVDVLKGEQKSEAYLNVNPLGVVPFLSVDEKLGIGESNAMLWFICEGSYLMPESAEERAEALQWMFFEQSKLEPFISPARFFTTILPELKASRAEDIMAWQSNAQPGLDRLNAHLEHRDFMLASGYSLTDIALFGYVHVLEEAGLNLNDFPAIKAWIDRVEATDAYKPLSSLGVPKALVA